LLPKRKWFVNAAAFVPKRLVQPPVGDVESVDYLARRLVRMTFTCPTFPEVGAFVEGETKERVGADALGNPRRVAWLVNDNSAWATGFASSSPKAQGPGRSHHANASRGHHLGFLADLESDAAGCP